MNTNRKESEFSETPNTFSERLMEAKHKASAKKITGQDIMHLDRFASDTKHMIVFDVLRADSPIGFKGDCVRLFLTDSGYQKALESQKKGFVNIINHAEVAAGNLHYPQNELTKE